MPTLVLSLLVALLLSQRHNGFMLVSVLLFLIPWFAYSCYRCIRFPAERRLRVQKSLVWGMAVLVIVSAHLVMFHSAQSYAQKVSEKIEAYISQHGHCPTGLEDLGISQTEFKEHLGLASYSCKDQRPSLFYASTYAPFDTEDYDFRKHEWMHVYD